MCGRGQMAGPIRKLSHQTARLQLMDVASYLRGRVCKDPKVQAVS